MINYVPWMLPFFGGMVIGAIFTSVMWQRHVRTITRNFERRLLERERKQHRWVELGESLQSLIPTFIEQLKFVVQEIEQAVESFLEGFFTSSQRVESKWMRPIT